MEAGKKEKIEKAARRLFGERDTMIHPFGTSAGRQG